MKRYPNRAKKPELADFPRQFAGERRRRFATISNVDKA